MAEADPNVSCLYYFRIDKGGSKHSVVTERKKRRNERQQKRPPSLLREMLLPLPRVL